MAPSPMVLEETFRIRSYEIDARERARVKTLTSYLQEVAGMHAESLGLSIASLQGAGRTWMLTRLRLEMDRWPRWGESLRVKTWPSGVESLLALRDFELLDNSGRRLGAATTAWMVVDMMRRRAVRLPQEVVSLDFPGRQRALEGGFEKLPIIDGVRADREFLLRRAEVDVNLHANQSAYVDWAVEAVPDDVWLERDLQSLEISFHAEARHGERILSGVERVEPGVYVHRLWRGSDGRDLARLRTRWSDPPRR